MLDMCKIDIVFMHRKFKVWLLKFVKLQRHESETKPTHNEIPYKGV